MFDQFGTTVAFTSYAIAAAISLLTAAIIWLMVKLIEISNRHHKS